MRSVSVELIDHGIYPPLYADFAYPLLEILILSCDLTKLK